MFLVTTADQRFWKMDEKILFLGEWCRRYSRKHVWSGVEHEVLSYHWDDRERFYRDCQFLDRIYESLLSQLGDRLNEIHQTDFPSRYWRIIIGPWLFYFIPILYDRFLSINEACESGKVTHTLIPDWDPNLRLARDFSDFQDGAAKDPFNQFLYAEIIRFSGKIPYETLDVDPQAAEKDRETGSQKPVSEFVKKLIQKLGRFIPDSMNRVVLINSYIKPPDLIRLQMSLGQLPYPYSPVVETKILPVNRRIREKLKFKTGATPFENLLQKIVPSLIPTVYVEGYEDMHRCAMKAFPGSPQVIYTTNALYGNEGFKFWAAWHISRGTKLVASQHGGTYGSVSWSAQEAHEIRVADRYFTWGWEESGDTRLVPMPSAQMAYRVRCIKPRPDGVILWVGKLLPRYFHLMCNVPIGPQVQEYLLDQKRFADAVSDEVSRLLVYRLFVKDYGWDQKERLADMIPSVELYEGPKSFYQQLIESRLCIHTYNSTTYLETFAANFPTLVFWNPKHWGIRDSARPWFDELREAGILHDTPESAAAKAGDIYQDPLAWWMSPAVQQVRERFCERFARTSPHWNSIWVQEFKKLSED